MNKVFIPKEIYQVDNYTFAILWSDGKVQHYRLSDLQKACPCAQCSFAKNPVKEDVRALYIASVGRYALRVQFASGCSNGIYSFDKLKEAVL